MKIRSAYDGTRVPVDLECDPELGKTVQYAADECDINKIVSSYDRTGLITHLNTAQPRFGDFTDAPDYQTALNAVIAAQAEFEQLPAALRKRFGNDPANLIDFMNDDSNREEAIRLGLVYEKEPLEPVKSAAGDEPDQLPT